MERLFVYGTLKKNFPAHYLLENSKFIKEDEVEGYSLWDMGIYPGAYICPGGCIKGEIYRVSYQILHNLDILENVPYLYGRGVVTPKSGVFPVIMYILSKFPENYTKIEGKSWEQNHSPWEPA